MRNMSLDTLWRENSCIIGIASPALAQAFASRRQRIPSGRAASCLYLIFLRSSIEVHIGNDENLHGLKGSL